MFTRPKYVVVLMGSSETTALGPFDSKGEAIDRAIEIIVGLGVDPYSTVADLTDALQTNSRNDVAIAPLAPARSKVGLGAA